ncbi:MAG: hypothetical protein KDC38_00360 [Planctomycetes bacterium]|nr:hypothetical protein [Planctomycetota bacterium]
MTMVGEPRTISRILEFFHLPVQHSPEVLRDIYMQVSSSCEFDNFLKIPGGARLVTAGESGESSSVSFMKDRVSFQEEQPSSSLEILLRRIEATLAATIGHCNIPLFVARNITFRAVLSVPRGETAPQFLSENFFDLSPEQFRSFDRPGALVGFRMQFPPKDPTREPLHQVRIEAYLRDPRLLFIEDWGTFKVPVPSHDFGRLSAEAKDVDSFLGDRLVGFLSQFGGGS